MNGTLQEALQGGKASPKMKTVWMLKWSARYIFTLIFFMFFFIFRIFSIFASSDLLILLLICILVPIILGFFISYLWANFYWNKYNFVLGQERITITRGVIGKRVTNIPYERVQNVNIFRGVLDRIFGLYSVQIETAGGFGIRGTGGYGTRMTAEGEIQGLTNPEPIAEFILSKAKGSSGLGEKIPERKLENNEKIKLLEERFVKGQISEKTYEELKKKYRSS
jgi:membrane protein YdbS with pleckstrin-like domain